jgi:hypothetical protein
MVTGTELRAYIIRLSLEWSEPGLEDLHQWHWHCWQKTEVIWQEEILTLC